MHSARDVLVMSVIENDINISSILLCRVFLSLEKLTSDSEANRWIEDVDYQIYIYRASTV